MRIDQDIVIAAPIDRAWAFLTDLPRVSGCVPGVDGIEVTGDDAVAGTIDVRVGPIGLRLAGQVRLVERDPVRHGAALEIQATDRRIGGGLTARTTFQLSSVGETVEGGESPTRADAAAAADARDALAGASTRLVVATDATLTGRLGQFGQPIIRRKSEELAKQFAKNVAAALADAATD